MAKANLEWFIWGGLIVYLVAKAANPKPIKIVITPTSHTEEFPGYKITDCTKVTIQDITKAKTYAFTTGKTTADPHDIFVKLFGKDDCLGYLKFKSKAEAQFVYDIISYFSAGAVAGKKNTLASSVVAINGMRDDFLKMGFDLPIATETTVQSIISQQ